MSLSEFRERYPEFTTEAFNDTVVTLHLTECASFLSADKYGSKYDLCLYLLTAHELTLIGKTGESSEVVVSRGIEGGSVTYKNLAQDSRELYYTKTAYGQKFLAIKKTVRFVGAVCL